MKRTFTAAFALLALTPALTLVGVPDCPMYDVNTNCKGDGPCIYWEQQDYDRSKIEWAEATDATKKLCALIFYGTILRTGRWRSMMTRFPKSNGK